MAASTDSVVRIAPDSTGKNVRNLQITTLVDGVEAVVQMQVIAIADATGQVLTGDRDVFVALLEAQTKTNELLQMLIDQF